MKAPTAWTYRILRTFALVAMLPEESFQNSIHLLTAHTIRMPATMTPGRNKEEEVIEDKAELIEDDAAEVRAELALSSGTTSGSFAIGSR